MRTVDLTDAERDLIWKAIGIAAEDGSLYPACLTDAEQSVANKRTNATIETIRWKLFR